MNLLQNDQKNQFQTYKKYNEITIKNILNNNNLDIIQKQLELEKILNFSINKLGDEKFINNKKFINFLNKLLNIDWFNIAGKTYLEKFFKIINKDFFIRFILIKVLFRLKYIQCYSADLIKNLLKSAFEDILYSNNILILHDKYNETNIKTEFFYNFILKHNIINSYEENSYLNIECTIKDNCLIITKENKIFKKLKIIELNVLERSLAYIVEYLKEAKIIIFDPILGRFCMEELLDLDIKDCVLLINQKWPLLIPAKDYEIIYNTYKGGFHLYTNYINLKIKNDFIKTNIKINKKLLKVIHKLQNKKYNLIKNTKVIDFLEKVEEYFSEEFFLDKENQKYIEDWYASYQFLMLVKNNINEIYFPYQLDFRGRIYNGISFGLNPTTNKLSRALINFGEIDLTEEMKKNIQTYICSSFKIYDFDIILNINLNYNDPLQLKELIQKYSIKNIILLLDWHENVMKRNKTEILIELDATQSGFQVLSLLSNDKFCMYNTNLLKSDKNKDLYSEILEKVIENLPEDKKKWSNILNRDFIKRVIMTIPYGSTTEGQLNMLINEYERQYSLKFLVAYNAIPLILKNNIIYDKKIEKHIKELEENINKKYKFTFKMLEKIQHELLNDLKKHMFKDLLKIINNVTHLLYPNIITFIKELKSLKIFSITTEFCTFPLLYFKEYTEKIIIRTKEYSKTYIDYTVLDNRKSKLAMIANICHGMGDAFIMHYFIYTFEFQLYPIHDAILCKVNDINEIKLKILETYKYIYLYYLNYEDFKSINIEKNIYNLDSLDIFKI